MIVDTSFTMNTFSYPKRMSIQIIKEIKSGIAPFYI